MLFQAAAGDTPACTDALTRSVGALPVVAARAMAEGQDAMHALSGKLQVRTDRQAVTARLVMKTYHIQCAILPWRFARFALGQPSSWSCVLELRIQSG